MLLFKTNRKNRLIEYNYLNNFDNNTFVGHEKR